MKVLEKQIKALAALVPVQDQRQAAVSEATVGWHLEHCLLVMQSFVKMMEKSIPADYQPHFSWRKYFLLGLGFLPRGKAKAPSRVVPREATNQEGLHEQIKLAQDAMQTLESLPDKAFMAHPIFGHLRKKTAIRFVQIHTEHHLKIIRDILAHR